MLVLLGSVGLGGCGERVPSDDAVVVDGLDGSYDGGPGIVAGQPSGSRPEGTPSDESTAPDRDTVDVDLTALSPSDAALAEHHLGARLGEGTWVVASPMTVDEAVRLLFGPDPETVDDLTDDRIMSGTISAYTVVQAGDGVVAYEDTGFADPPRRLLAALSQGGGTSAVVTDNIDAMTRFGYARDGQVVFDEPEYAFVEDLDEIPAEVRDLARLAWEDLDGPQAATADWSAVGLAMAEKVTGVRASRDARNGTDWYVVPMAWGAMEDY